MNAERPKRRRERFHGRIERADPGPCAASGCGEAGEFRAPAPEGGWQYLCLDHVRAFNAGYSYRAPERRAAEAPGWERATRKFASNAYAGSFADPVGALSGRFGAKVFSGPEGRGAQPLSPESERALNVLGLSKKASAAEIRASYKGLIRRYHPDMNGGDRSQEAKLRGVIDAYTQLRNDPAFAG